MIVIRPVAGLGAVGQPQYLDGKCMLNCQPTSVGAAPAPDMSQVSCAAWYGLWARENPEKHACMSDYHKNLWINSCDRHKRGEMTLTARDNTLATITADPCGTLTPAPTAPPPVPAPPIDAAPPPAAPPAGPAAMDQVTGQTLPSDTTQPSYAQPDSGAWWWFVAAIAVVGGGAYLLR